MLPWINISYWILYYVLQNDHVFFSLVLAVKLPELLTYVTIEEETLNRLQQKLLDFLK